MFPVPELTQSMFVMSQVENQIIYFLNNSLFINGLRFCFIVLKDKYL